MPSKKTKKTSAEKGPEAFDKYYQLIYGSRWESLKVALPQPSQRRVNLVSAKEPKEVNSREQQIWQEGQLCLSLATERMDSHYQLDMASVLPIVALNPQPGGRVLDLCSAPGGKALVTMHWMQSKGHWILNEMSQPRLNRLKSVMKEYAPVGADSITFYKRNGEKWGLSEPCSYDYVIVDVPCSGEAHLLNNRLEMEKWTAKRGQRLAHRQWALLCAGWQVLKPGGKLVYSTCSVNPKENQDVVSRMEKRREGQYRRPDLDIDEFFAQYLEPLEWGYNVFPDKNGMGPIYFCVLEKIDH